MNLNSIMLSALKMVNKACICSILQSCRVLTFDINPKISFWAFLIWELSPSMATSPCCIRGESVAVTPTPTYTIGLTRDQLPFGLPDTKNFSRGRLPVHYLIQVEMQNATVHFIYAYEMHSFCSISSLFQNVKQQLSWRISPYQRNPLTPQRERERQ